LTLIYNLIDTIETGLCLPCRLESDSHRTPRGDINIASVSTWKLRG